MDWMQQIILQERKPGMSKAQSREFQLNQIRKLEKEVQSASSDRRKEIENEIAVRTKDIRNLEELIQQEQGKTKHDIPKVKQYDREVPQTGKGIGGSR
jgi:predicted  nucleic acid-binding Zn-ribbon protein